MNHQLFRRAADGRVILPPGISTIRPRRGIERAWLPPFSKRWNRLLLRAQRRQARGGAHRG